MTVKELIELLENEDHNKLVVMSKDGEGNSYSPLADFGNVNVYRADSTWSGDVGFSKLTPKLKKAGYSFRQICKLLKFGSTRSIQIIKKKYGKL
jgi:hypothetical protein